MATNFDATSPLIESANNVVGSNLGYDAVSRYGDVGNTFGATGGAQAGVTNLFDAHNFQISAWPILLS